MGPACYRFAMPLLLLALTLLAGCASVDGPVELRLLVYNIHAGKDAAGAPNLERVAAVIRSTRADVVLLQEVDIRTIRSGGVDQLDEVARMTRLEPLFGKSLDYDSGEYGIAILSRLPIRSRRALPLRVDPPQKRAGGSVEPRIALIAEVQTARGGTLRIINTHLDASRDDRYRLQEVATLAAAVREGEAVILGGDLNATPENPLHHHLRAKRLRDAWDCGTGEGGTYPASAPEKRIDYLYFSQHFDCVSAEVLESDASDHRPLLVRLRIRP